MPVINHAARYVDVCDRIAVQQQLSMCVVEEECCDGKRANHERKSSFITLLLPGIAGMTSMGARNC